MAIEQDILKAITNLNRMIQKFDNTVASSVGSERSNNSRFANQKSPNEKSSEDIFDDKLKELSKAAKRASKNLDENIDSAAKHISTGFSDIVQRMGNSVTNAFPFKVMSKTINESLIKLEDDLGNSSPDLKNAIREYISSSLGETQSDTDSFIVNAHNVSKGFTRLNGILNEATQSQKLSKENADDLIGIIGDLNTKGIDVYEMFDDTDGVLGKLINKLEAGSGEIKGFSEDTVNKLKDVTDNIQRSGDVFGESVLNTAKHIDDTLSKSFKDLARKSDNLGANLTTAIKVGLGPAAVMEANALSTLVQDGFRSVDLIDLGVSAADFGQSQTDFSNNLKEFRTAIRLLAQSPDTMGFAAGETFNSISEDIRNRFGIAGTQNTQFLGKQLETFAELGIKPTLSATQTLNKEIQELSGLGDKSAQEIQDTFLALSKDKSFKSFFMSLGGGERGLSGLSDTFKKLQKQVGLNIDEFVSLQQELASQRDREAPNRVVEGAFAARLASELGGFNSEQISLIKQGTAYFESLNSSQQEEFQGLLKEAGGKLFEARNQAFANQDTATATRLDVLRGRAGIFGQERAEVTAAQTSGRVDLFQEIQADAIKTANIETDNVTKFATAVTEFVKGIKSSPVGIGMTGVAGVFADLGATLAGGALMQSVISKGLKKTVTGLFTGLGKGIWAGIKKIPFAAGLYGIWGGFTAALEEQDGFRKPAAFAGGLWDNLVAKGVGNIMDGISNVFGDGTLDMSGFLQEWNPLELFGTKLGEWAAMGVETVGGWFDSAGDFFSSAFDNVGSFLGGINDTVSGWFDYVADGVGGVLNDASGMISDISSGVGTVLDDAGDFIVDGFTTGWDAITSFFGDGDSPAKRVNKKEQELLAKQGEERLQSTLNDLSKYMSDLVEEQKARNEQANEHHIENKLDKKMSERKRFHGMLSNDMATVKPV